jgi:Icc-related predicted phosphoesterase
LFWLNLLFGLAGVFQMQDVVRVESMPEPAHALYRYVKARSGQCVGDGIALEHPVEMTLAGKKVRFDGSSLSLLDSGSSGTLTIGILGAIKDFALETQDALGFYLKTFHEEGVDILVLLGDIASDEKSMVEILLTCAKWNWPVLSLIGNSEGKTAFNRANLLAMKASENIINFDLIRRVDVGGVVLVGLPGYMDRKFLHHPAGCTYRPSDVEGLDRLIEGTTAPIVFFSHGPPMGQGRQALDVAVEAGNVGDRKTAAFLASHAVPFGVFSHILEAGGRAVDDQGKRINPGEASGRLYLNAGSANPLPWQLNNGKMSCGMAMVLRIKEGKAAHLLIEHPCPKN